MGVTQNNKIVEIETLYNSMVEEQRELRKQFQEKARGLFNRVVADFFEMNPAINLIQWVQIVPYFNDGEACEFSVHEPYFSNATVDDLDEISSYGEYDGDNPDIWSESNFSWAIKNRDREYYKKAAEAVDAGGINVESCDFFSKMIQNSEFEDVMRDMFGEHARIQITRETGIDCQEYTNHD